MRTNSSQLNSCTRDFTQGRKYLSTINCGRSLPVANTGNLIRSPLLLSNRNYKRSVWTSSHCSIRSHHKKGTCQTRSILRLKHKLASRVKLCHWSQRTTLRQLSFSAQEIVWELQDQDWTTKSSWKIKRYKRIRCLDPTPQSTSSSD